jgi:hypothetical protein
MSNRTIIFRVCLGVSVLAFAGNLRAQSVIVSPAGGEEIASGVARTILWDPHAVTGNVTLSLWDGQRGTWTPIASNIPASEGKALWSVPANLAGKLFRIKLTTDNGSLHGSALSRTFFTIVQKPLAQVESKVVLPPGQFITLTPNPAQDMVECSWPGGGREIALVDVLGHIVRSYPVASSATSLRIPTHGLAAGTYYVRVTFANGTVETRPLAVE